MKLAKILTIEKSITALIALDEEKKLILSGSARYKLGRNISRVRPMGDEYRKRVNDLVVKMGVKAADSDLYSIPHGTPAFVDFQKQLEVMLNVEEDVKFFCLTHVELFGEPKLAASDQNQVDIKLVGDLIAQGLLEDLPSE